MEDAYHLIILSTGRSRVKFLYVQESPTSDDVEKRDVPSTSSSESTPLHEETYVPFRPVYAVTVTEPVKNGDVIQYTVTTTRLSSDDSDIVTVTRQYDDFEYLHHCLQAQNPNDGIIVSIISLCCTE